MSFYHPQCNRISPSQLLEKVLEATRHGDLRGLWYLEPLLIRSYSSELSQVSKRKFSTSVLQVQYSAFKSISPRDLEDNSFEHWSLWISCQIGWIQQRKKNHHYQHPNHDTKTSFIHYCSLYSWEGGLDCFCHGFWYATRLVFGGRDHSLMCELSENIHNILLKI